MCRYWANPGGKTDLPSLKPFKLDEQDMWGTAGEVRTKSKTTFSNGPLHTDVQVLNDELEHIYNSSAGSDGR